MGSSALQLLLCVLIFSARGECFSVQYLHSDRCTNNHRLFQEFFNKFRRVVVHVDDGDEDFRQAVLPLRILSLDVKVVFRPDLCVQGGPGLRGDDAR